MGQKAPYLQQLGDQVLNVVTLEDGVDVAPGVVVLRDHAGSVLSQDAEHFFELSLCRFLFDLFFLPVLRRQQNFYSSSNREVRVKNGGPEFQIHLAELNSVPLTPPTRMTTDNRACCEPVRRCDLLVVVWTHNMKPPGGHWVKLETGSFMEHILIHALYSARV